MSQTIQIVTHNGVFHADDVAAVATLENFITKMGNHPLLSRTRDESEITSARYVVDVGAVYSPEAGRFDHHQPGGAGIVRSNGLPYSSFGLVWKEFGFMVCGRQDVADEIERRLVIPIDAADCGMKLYEGGRPVVEGIEGYSLSQVISSFNPRGNDSDEKDFDGDFRHALRFFGQLLLREIEQATAKLDNQAAVLKAVIDAPDRRLIELAHGGPGWQDVVCLHHEPLYIVFPAETGDTWMVQCVPPAPGSFDKRKPLPRAWTGLRGGELAAVTDVQDAVFCHNGLFICGARSREGALRLARMAIEA